MMGFTIATRAALAAGLALTFGDRLPARQRRTVGTALIAVGAATTIPIVSWLVHRRAVRRGPGVEIDPTLAGSTRFPRKGDELLQHTTDNR